MNESDFEGLGWNPFKLPKNEYKDQAYSEPNRTPTNVNVNFAKRKSN